MSEDTPQIPETQETPSTETTADTRRQTTPSPQRRASSQQRRSSGRYSRRRRVCSFCVDKIDYIDYKQPDLLKQYITEHGKIVSRRRSGTCAKHQRRLATAIKRARYLALLPYTAEHIRLYGHGGQ